MKNILKFNVINIMKFLGQSQIYMDGHNVSNLINRLVNYLEFKTVEYFDGVLL